MRAEIMLGAAASVMAVGFWWTFHLFGSDLLQDEILAPLAAMGLLFGSMGLIAATGSRYYSFHLPRACVGRSIRSDFKGPTPGPLYLAFRKPFHVCAWFDKALGVNTHLRWDPVLERLGNRIRWEVVATQVAFYGIMVATMFALFVTSAGTRSFGLMAFWIGLVTFGTYAMMRWHAERWAAWYRKELLEPGLAAIREPTWGPRPSYSNFSTSMPRAKSPVNK